MLGLALIWLSAPPPAGAFGKEALFRFAVLRTHGGGDFGRQASIAPMIAELERRTSVHADPAPVFVNASDPEIFNNPFLLLAGADEFAPFNEQELANLRRYLQYGGFLFADNSQLLANYGFDKSFRAFAAALFPDRKLERVPSDHPLFQSFYMIEFVPGRNVVNPFFEGIAFDGRTPVIYCHNDLSGAWARDALGNFVFPVTPGGERQREMSFRQGVNLIMYALTVDYKKDQVHIPFILQRRR
jgi:hypothetical protein